MSAPPDPGGPAGRAARRRHRRTLLGVLVVVLLVLASGAVAVGLLGERGRPATSVAEGPCPGARTVRVVVDPALASSLRPVAEEASGTVLSTGACVDVEVLAVPSAQTAAALADPTAFGGSSAPAEGETPDVWVPDSSVWLGRAVEDPPRRDLTLTALGSLVSTPLVVATTPEVVGEAGWAGQAPTWEQVLASGRPVALPGLATSAPGVQSLLALQASVTDPEARREALARAAAAVRAAGTPGTRGTPATDAVAALAALQDAGAAAALVPTTEQQVFARGRGSVRTDVVAVRPAGPVSHLDHPVVRVDTPADAAGVDAAAVEGVVRLLETAGREALLGDGFREPTARPLEPSAQPSPGASTAPSPAASAPDTGSPRPVARWSEVEALLLRLEELGRPSRVLLVLDATASMRGVTATGATRAQVTQDAVAASLDLLDDSSAAGLWFFAAGLGTDAAGAPTDHVEVVPLRPLDPAVAGVDQRAALLAGTADLGARLAPGGSGLFDTVLAAVRSVREGDDPDAVSSVVVLTDGAQEDPGAPGLDELVATLGAEADPARPVPVTLIGISPDVDAAELTALAAATGGTAALAEAPEDVATLLAEALRRR